MEPRPVRFGIGVSEVALIIIAIFVILAYFTGWNN